MCFITDNLWVVYILHEGIERDVKLTGRHILTPFHCNYKLNVLHIGTGNHLLTWDGDKVWKCCIYSLVYIEVGSRWQEGPGLLWMQHPIPSSMELYKCLHKLVS